MSFTAMNFITLETELLAGHPVTGSYSLDAPAAAKELNEINIARIKPFITGSEMLSATDVADLSGLVVAKRSEWITFCGVDQHNPENNGVAHQFVEYIFGNPSITRTNLIEKRNETVSQATNLGIEKVEDWHIIQVRNG